MSEWWDIKNNKIYVSLKEWDNVVESYLITSLIKLWHNHWSVKKWINVIDIWWRYILKKDVLKCLEFNTNKDG
jgi:hypothetical protein